MNPKEIPDYSFRYQQGTANRKRQLIEYQLQMLHETHLEMLEQALTHSDMSQAKEVIRWIMEK